MRKRREKDGFPIFHIAYYRPRFVARYISLIIEVVLNAKNKRIRRPSVRKLISF